MATVRTEAHKTTKDDSSWRLPNEQITMKNICKGCVYMRNVPHFLLSTVLLLSILKPTPTYAKPVTCPINSIAWRNKSTGTIIACMSCVECVPSEQYSIPCGETVDIGTNAKCEPCPLGTYSDKFDTKRCKHCTKCTNKVIKQNCTGSQNAICGACLEGYEYDHHIFACVLKEKPPVLSTVPPTLHSPTTGNTTVKTTGNTTVKTEPPKSSSTTERRTGTTPTTPTIVTPNSAPDKHAHSGDNNSLNSSIVIAVVLFCTVLLILLILAVLYIIRQNKEQSARCQFVKYSSRDDSTGECMVMIEKDLLLKDFFERNTCQEDVQEVCNFLLKRRFRTTDCERVAHKWKFKKADIMVLRNETDAPNGCPGKILIETLILSIKPSTTVREFADSLKNINHDAYDVLMKHCTVPAYVENTT